MKNITLEYYSNNYEKEFCDAVAKKSGFYSN